jgi:predicted GTPase
LHQWSKADEQAIRPLIQAIQRKQCLSDIHIKEPRWETNVYPLYYWAHREVGSKRVYRYVLELLPKLFSPSNVSLTDKELRLHLRRIVNSEIDILVEDFDYFLFIEAKVATAGQKIKFQTIAGVHQLVRQYIQGRILEKLIGKRFDLVTIGAHNAQTIKIPFNTTEQALLSVVNEEKKSLQVIDFPWTLISEAS